MNDLIYKEDAIKAAIIAADEWDGGFNIQREEMITDAINALTSVNPEPKNGRWYKPTGMMPPEYAGRYRCSECDGFAMHDWKSHREVLTDFCPWCGADMRGEQND